MLFKSADIILTSLPIYLFSVVDSELQQYQRLLLQQKDQCSWEVPLMKRFKINMVCEMACEDMI